MTGEDFERSPAAGLLADFARRKLLRLHESARETLALCEGENGPLHYAAACGTDVRLTADLAAAAAEGYTALHDALHGVTFAALGRKKKTDLFDEDIADRVKARRDAVKKAVGELQTAFGLTMAEAAADIRMTAAPLDGLAELAKTYDTLYTAAKRQRGLMDFDDLEHSALAALELPGGAIGAARTISLCIHRRIPGFQRDSGSHRRQFRAGRRPVPRRRREAEHLSLPAGRTVAVPAKSGAV